MSVTADAATNKSTQTFVTAFVTGLIAAGAQLAIFLVIRNRFRKVYNPRSYLVAPHKRVDPLPHGLFAWIPAILKADARQIIDKNGLDAYVFVRFLYLMIELFLPFMIVTWIILLPVDAAGSKGTNTGIEKFTFGNIGLSAQPRYAAHLIIVWILTFYVFYLIRRELSAFVLLRQDFLLSKEHMRLAQSKTVLVTGVPKDLLTIENMTQFSSVLPGGVKRVWLVRNLKELPDLYERRTKACSKLESAETKYLKLAAKAILKENKANVKAEKKSAPKGSELPQTTMDVNKMDIGEISKWVPQKKRPTHKLGFLGLIGKKVDSIDWSREEIATTNRLIEEERDVINGPGGGLDKYPNESAAFIQFNEQIAAHMFTQCLAHHTPLSMSARYLEVAQEDVIWSNLNISPYQAKGRYAISWVMTIGLIILWAFPVAFVGLLSNVSALCLKASWLAWLCKLPVPVNGIIQGALPPVALAVLFIFLPIILRKFAKFQGIPLHTQIELSLMTRFFLFLVIHGFLIVTLASGLVAAIPQIASDPSSAVTLLATKLPAASTFFLTYFVTTSLAGSAGGLLQIATLAIYYIKMFLLGSTPRAVYNIKFNMSGVAWGTLFPNMTLLTVIGLTYSVIAPLVSGFAFLAFGLFWFVYKYLMLWVIDIPNASETGGLFYPKAIGHIFVGLYIEQICLAGLFFLAQNAAGHPSAIPEGVFMVILIILTIFFHLTMNSAFNPLHRTLPLSFAPRIQAAHKQNGSGVDGNSQTSPYHSEKTGNTSFPPPQVHDTGRDQLIEKQKAGSDLHSDNTGPGMVDTRTATLPGDEHLNVHAFDHPATYEGYKTIWIPVDEAGLYAAELEGNQAAGVDISTQGAVMNAKGTVDVSRSPPGEDWDESQQL